MGKENSGPKLKSAKRASGHTAMATLAQLAVMAALVATMAYFPLGLVLILLLRIAGLGYETLITFGGSFGTFAGLIAWWLLVFTGAFVYAAFMFPWEDKVFGWPRKD